ncbi:hypothetical protein ILYODFUR_025498 [Ilyodon furcidens]|uniref:Ig-like domain-containing protein n=1 Tax=Ilyodon furcidens TaxID=33524 RepID=A0ABV0T0B5_9TELE
MLLVQLKAELRCREDGDFAVAAPSVWNKLPLEIKMIALLGTLLLVHCGYTFILVKPVLQGEPVTFNCDLPDIEITRRQVHWYKQSPGDTLRLIVILTMRHQKPAASELASEFHDSRWLIDNNKTFSSLKIVSATPEDEGTYHCAVMDWIGTNKWNGTYLIVKGKLYDLSSYKNTCL